MAGTANGDGQDPMQKILDELRKMNKVMTLVNGDKIETQLAKFATTPERKKIWALMDGTRDMGELIRASGLKQAPVYKFVTALENAQLVQRAHGQPPIRVVDFVPAEWAELAGARQTNDGGSPSIDDAGQGSTNTGGDNNGQ